VSAPKYKVIEQALVARIAAGEFAPGDPIPHEAELAAAYGVTRPTIGRALSALVEQGLIERKRRAGSRVAVRGRVAARLAIPLVREEIAATGAAYGYRLLARKTAPPPAEVARLFGLTPGAAALRTDALHLADGRPWQRESRWINLKTVPAAARADFATVSPNEWLVREAPFTRIAHEVAAEPADADTARLLGMAEGAPVLRLRRRTWLGEGAITQVEMRHPGDRYRLRLDGGE
jgi:GntR family histidine utilization transcriptional repressor